jgi:hypothetical protein
MDRIPSDNPAVETIDATVERTGSVDRPRVVLPAERADALPTDDVVRVVLNGDEYRTRPDPLSDGRVAIAGAFDTPDAARDPRAGENRLPAWVEGAGLDYGRTVHVDVVEPAFLYGLRAPGERAVYDAVERPDDSLASIAEDL